jgi:hypothetical protein
MPFLMRHRPLPLRLCWVLALMVLLLPLRGWAGSTMAVTMAMQQVAAVHAGPMAEMPDDCPMRIRGSDAGEAPADGQTDSSGKPCGACDTCALCLAIASFPSPQFHTMAFKPSTTPPDVAHGFFSADHASRLKPPIS